MTSSGGEEGDRSAGEILREEMSSGPHSQGVVIGVPLIAVVGLVTLPGSIPRFGYSHSVGSGHPPPGPEISTEVFAAPERPPHAPISIYGNSQFTTSNGVIAGRGTSAALYIIALWTIAANDTTGISITDTTTFFTVENLTIVMSSTPSLT